MRDTGTTQADLAERLGCSKGFVSHLMRGRRDPSLVTAVTIERLTQGRVRASDWVPASSDEAEAA